MIHNVVVPLDGSAYSERALPVGNALAHAADAKVTVLGVAPSGAEHAWFYDRVTDAAYVCGRRPRRNRRARRPRPGPGPPRSRERSPQRALPRDTRPDAPGDQGQARGRFPRARSLASPARCRGPLRFHGRAWNRRRRRARRDHKRGTAPRRRLVLGTPAAQPTSPRHGVRAHAVRSAPPATLHTRAGAPRPGYLPRRHARTRRRRGSRPRSTPSLYRTR